MSGKSNYDEVVAYYETYRSKSDKIWFHEVENVKRVLSPYIQNAKILELACGTGFYTYDMMEWGAASVLATDVSAGMLDAARRQSQASKWGSSVSLMQVDCTLPVTLPGAPYDVIFAAKLLTHAPDLATMVQMCKTVTLNLKRGGTFFTVTSPVTEEPKAYFEQENAALHKYGLTVNKEFAKEIPDGIMYRMANKWPSNQKEEDKHHYGYRLKKSVYEAAVREAGLTGKLEWMEMQPPAAFLSGEDTSPAIQKQVSWPDIGILVVAAE